jgi:hypothetical protein
MKGLKMLAHLTSSTLCYLQSFEGAEEKGMARNATPWEKAN